VLARCDQYCNVEGPVLPSYAVDLIQHTGRDAANAAGTAGHRAYANSISYMSMRCSAVAVWQFPYTEAVVRESLRLYPPATLLNREIREGSFDVAPGVSGSVEAPGGKWTVPLEQVFHSSHGGHLPVATFITTSLYDVLCTSTHFACGFGQQNTHAGVGQVMLVGLRFPSSHSWFWMRTGAGSDDNRCAPVISCWSRWICLTCLILLLPPD